MKKAIVSAAIAVSACLPISAAVGPKSFDDAIGVAVEKGHPRLFAGADGFAAVEKGHPRLFAGADGFAGIKPAAKKGSLRELALKRVIERSDLLLGTQPVERKMTGRRLLGTSRTALYRISTLSMAYRVTGERRYL